MKFRGRPPKTLSHRLAQWLRDTGRTRASFAREINGAELGVQVSEQRLHNICRGDDPGAPLARAIVKLTDGAVTMADLYRGRGETAA